MGKPIAAVDDDTIATSGISRLNHLIGPSGWVFLALCVLVAVAPFLPLPSPEAQSLSDVLLPPLSVGSNGEFHLLGTDSLGRDTLSRLLAGGRLTLMLTLGAAVIGGAFGVAVGLTAGFVRGKTDAVVSRVIDAQLALPIVLIAIALASSTSASTLVLLLTLSIVGWAEFARVVRSEVLSMRERPFVLALRGLGLTESRILFHHVVRACLPLILTIALLQLANLILIESALSFLGVGVVPPDVSWGLMLAEARQYLRTDPLLSVWPGLAIAVFVFLVFRIGARFSDRLEGRLT